MSSKSGRYPASGGGPLEHPSGVPVVWVDGVDVTPRSLLPSLSAGVLKGAEVSESAQSEASLFDFKAPPEEGTKTPEEVGKYARVFFAKINTLNNGPKILQKIEKAQKHVNFNMRAPKVIATKVATMKHDLALEEFSG